MRSTSDACPPRPAGRSTSTPVRAAARTAQVVWLCNPNNPTGLAEPPGAIESLLDALAVDAGADGRQPPIVALDEAYAEFTGETLLSAPRVATPTSS